MLIDSMQDIICFKDGEGRWLVANQSDLRLFGIEHVDYRGKRIPSSRLSARLITTPLWVARPLTKSHGRPALPVAQMR